MFNPNELSLIVKSIIPPGHDKAVVGLVNGDGAQLVASMNFNTNIGQWEVQASYEHKWSGDDKGMIKVLWSF